MESTTQKLIHTFGALADLGQEIANKSEFNEMVRTSLHLLLGTLAIRRGAVVECLPESDGTDCLALWGLGLDAQTNLQVNRADQDAFLAHGLCLIKAPNRNPAFAQFLEQHEEMLQKQGIEVIAPMVVRGELTGLVLLGGKANGEPFEEADLEVIRAIDRKSVV